MQRVEAPTEPELSQLREFLAATEQHDGTPPVSDQAMLAVTQGKRALHVLHDEPVGHQAATGDASLLAIGIVGEGELDLVVRPDARSKGIGSQVLRNLLQDQPIQCELRAWAHGENPAATALLEQAGFTPARLLLRMTLDPAPLPSALGAAREMPSSIEVRPYSAERPALGTLVSDAEEWVRVNAAAFAEHPEQGSMTLTDFGALTREHWFSAEDLRLAWLADPGPKSLAGFAWVKTTRNEGTVETELYALAVDPGLAGKGLGAALLGETLRQMATHRPDRITLYVDGDNTAAVELYERAGFEVEQRSTQWVLGPAGAHANSE